MITARLRGADVAQKRLRDGANSAFKAVEDAVTREALNLVAVIKLKLSDDVLHVRTGRLRRSITAKFEGAGTGTFRALVGTNVRYARVHELGFVGSVTVPSHSVKGHERMQTIAFGKLMKNPRKVQVREHVVKEHSFKMSVKARPFIRPSLEENKERIMTNIRKAIAKVLHESR